MKKLFLALALIISFSVVGQTDTTRRDSSKIEVPITLKAKHHIYIVSFLADKGTSTNINYLLQVRSKLDSIYNPEKAVRVTMPLSLIADIYYTIGRQESRLADDYNRSIKAALAPQLTAQTWIRRRVAAIDASSLNEIEARINRGKDYLMQIKYN